MSIITQNLSGDLIVAHNITSTAGIFYGNGSGLTNISPGDISGTPTDFAYFDPTTGVLSSSAAITQDVSNNLTIAPLGTMNINATGQIQVTSAANSIAVNSNMYLNNFLAFDQNSNGVTLSQQVSTADNTPTLLFTMSPNINSTALVKFIIIGNNTDVQGNGVTFTG